MKSSNPLRISHGLTLIELTVVLLVLLAMVGVGLHYSNAMGEWKNGKDAGEKLRTVYAAQKSYLADNPTVVLTSLSNTTAQERILPYLPTGEATMPTMQTKDGSGTLTVKANISPPVALDGSTVYDPSGSTSDGLWDVGL